MLNTCGNIIIMEVLSMYIYELSISMADKRIKFHSDEDELVLAIKRSIEIANKSYSATRYHRHIEYIERINEDKIHIQMTSPEPINPVRCITNLSRALLKDAYWIDNFNEENLPNKCVFSTKVLENEKHEKITSLSDTEILKELISIFVGQGESDSYTDKKQAREVAEKIREIVIEYVNRKNDIK